MSVRIKHLHRWDVSAATARQLQDKLRHHVITHEPARVIHLVAGIDVGFEAGGSVARAAVVVLSFPQLECIEAVVAKRRVAFPYIPGLLSFREVPAVLDALTKLKAVPDMLLCDGQGLAHPRRFGVACHIGVLTGLPSVGVAKSRLVGTHASVADVKGAWVELWDADEVIGAVLRTRQGVKPIFISIGHRVTLRTAIDVVMQCVTRYRLPETTRWSDQIASNRH